MSVSAFFYVCMNKIMHNYIMNKFFYIFPNLFFSKTNTAKNIPLIIFDVFILLLLFLKNNFTKGRGMYEYVWTNKYIHFIYI